MDPTDDRHDEPTADREGRDGLRRGAAARAARAVSHVLDPLVLAVAMLVAVALHEDPAALPTAAAMAAVIAGIPYAVLRLGMRSGRFEGRHVPEREQRPLLLATGALAVAAGLLLGWLLGAPRALVALVVAMLAGAAVTLAITLVWKISLHAGVAAGSLVSLVVVVGPLAWALAPVLVLVCWSRLALRVHTPAQVAAGVVVGGAVAAAVMVPLAG